MKIFDSHLKSLNTKTRPINDWVQDVILHNWSKKFSFSMTDAVDVLGDNFNFYNSSPKFLTDDRFYKKIGFCASRSNDLLKEQYPLISPAMLDYRLKINEVDKFIVKDIGIICDEIEALHDVIVNSNNYADLDNFILCLKSMKEILPESFGLTKLSIDDYINNFPRMIDSDSVVEFSDFTKWWGRGQQYVSLVRVSN